MENRLKDFQRIRFLRLLFEGFLRYRDLYLPFVEKEELPDPAEVEQLTLEVFSNLRESAHAIFRPSADFPETIKGLDTQLLCDLVIGACYHEILQLNENLVLSKLYRPRYESFQLDVGSESFAEYLEIGEDLIREAEIQIPRNIDWIWKLLLEALALLKSILPDQRDNKVVIRYLTQHISVLEKIYEPEDLEELFSTLFPGGMVEAVWSSAKDLLSSTHYNSALDAYSRLIMLLKEKKTSTVVSGEDIVKGLSLILEWGRTTRDNDMVSRSEALIAEVGGNPG